MAELDKEWYLFLFRPCPIPDSLLNLTSKNQEVRERYAAHGARDWEQILLMRGKELVSGTVYLDNYLLCVNHSL